METNLTRLVLEALLGVPSLFLVFLMLGRWLKRKRGVELGTMYQVFALVFSVWTITEYLDLKFPLSRHLGAASIILSAFLLNPLVDRILWQSYFENRRQVRIPIFLTQVAALGLFAGLVLSVVGFGYDVHIPGLLTGSGIMAVVLGLASQDLLGNVLSCFAILFGKPFRVGDWLILDSRHAEVMEINWRSTRLRTNDHVYLDVPNNHITKQVIVNLSYPNPAHAMRMQIGLEYEVPPNVAKEALFQATMKAAYVLQDPAPRVFLVQFGDSSVHYEIKFWLQDHADYNNVVDAIRTNVWYALQREGLGIPFPIQTLHIQKTPAKPVQEPMESTLIELSDRSPFSTFSPEAKRLLFHKSRRQLFGASETIITQGDPGTSMFIMVQGSAQVMIKEGATTRNVATLYRGDCFGEMSLLTGEQRSATIVAVTDCELFEIGKESMAGIFSTHPELLNSLSELVAKRKLENELARSGPIPQGEERRKHQQYRDKFFGSVRSFFDL